MISIFFVKGNTVARNIIVVCRYINIHYQGLWPLNRDLVTAACSDAPQTEKHIVFLFLVPRGCLPVPTGLNFSKLTATLLPVVNANMTCIRETNASIRLN